MITFTVYGTAQPKGSTRAFLPKGSRRPVVTSATRGLKDWEHKIADVAQRQCTGTLLQGPVCLAVTFYLPRPLSLRHKAGTLHVKRPDLDKLVRGATDALTHVLWRDDSQIVSICAQKHYAASVNEAPRAEFRIQAAP